ncbi:alpha/beta hydrolase [Thauera sp. SDU_THAU2]|uniref:alpha/beta hydrolase n=1 Tax=Thauera sp. SDU_THAU2 TaxID=3136633 RepID=UPI00311FF568
MNSITISMRDLILSFLMAVGMLLCLPAQAARVAAESAVTIGQRFSMRSEVLGEDRKLLIHLPKDYGRSRQRYPVLFILDGNEHFDYASALVDFLARAGRAPQLIVVAVPSMQQRGRDLTMPLKRDEEHRDREPYVKLGGSADFLRFLADELAPWVDGHYRTEPFRILSGHSLGGLFNFYALLERPDAFQAHIVPSPSLWWDKEYWVQQAKERIGNLPGRHWLYFSWGDGENDIRDSAQKLVGWMERQEFGRLKWTSRYYAGDEHLTTPLRTLYEGLQWLYKGWRSLGDMDFDLDSYDRKRYDNFKKVPYAEFERRVTAHYDRLSRIYGYTVEPDIAASALKRQWLMANDRHDEALAEARADLAAYPEHSASLHRTISWLLDKQGRTAEALAEYRKALSEYERFPELLHEYGTAGELEFRLEELERKLAEQEKKDE